MDTPEAFIIVQVDTDISASQRTILNICYSMDFAIKKYNELAATSHKPSLVYAIWEVSTVKALDEILSRCLDKDVNTDTEAFKDEIINWHKHDLNVLRSTAW